MSFTRREFLKECSRGMSAATMMAAFGYAFQENAFAQGTDYRAAVCLFWEGGNDGLNTVVPMDTAAYNTYRTSRAGMALARESLLPLGNVPGQNATFGLHPSLPGLQSLWQQGKVAFALHVGNLIGPVTPQQILANPKVAPDGIFDHFQQQVFSQNLTNANVTGWGGRLNTVLPIKNTAPVIPPLMTVVTNPPWAKSSGPFINLQPGLQLGITGLPTTGTPPARFTGLQSVEALIDTSQMVNTFNLRVSDAIDKSRVLGNIFANQPFTTVFPNTGIGQQLRQIAIAIAARDALGHNRRQLFYAQVQGNAFDTHGTQLTSQARLLSESDAAILAFYRTMVELGVENNVVLFTFSEFGRTVAQNGDGTDHGYSNIYPVIGGPVLGGRFYGGQYPEVRVNNGIDYPLFGVSGNFRGAFVPQNSMDQYGNTIAQWLGLPDSAAGDVFPNLRNFSTRTMGFLPV